jgi:hypothetical protein
MKISQIPDEIILKYEDDSHFLELILDKKNEENIHRITKPDYYYEGRMLDDQKDCKG